MTVQWFRITIKGTKTKINTIKTWIDNKIEVLDLDENLASGRVNVYQDSTDDNFVLGFNAFFKNNVSKTKYPNLVKNKLETLNKNGLTSIVVEKYDNCSHDSDNPQPCVSTEVYKW